MANDALVHYPPIIWTARVPEPWRCPRVDCGVNVRQTPCSHLLRPPLGPVVHLNGHSPLAWQSYSALQASLAVVADTIIALGYRTSREQRDAGDELWYVYSVPSDFAINVPMLG